jgi:3',5'-nucleoside bisphosphate phosphatase
MNRRADLHLHTSWSDGIRSSRAVIDLAIEHQLEIIAISDHDNVGAYHEIAGYAADRGIQLIPAIELSTSHGGEDVHLLAYGFDASSQRLEDTLEAFRQRRRSRSALMVERLIELGVPISRERVIELAGSGSMGRPHIARALLESGAVTSFQEAFERYLSPGMPGYVDVERITARAAIDLIHQLGGITSVAHPTVYLNHHELVTTLIDEGLDAIEIFHPDVRGEEVDFYLELAKQRHLLVTGGSDDHGFEGAMAIGTSFLQEPYLAPLLERLGAT